MGLIILCEESFCRRKMSMTQDEKWIARYNEVKNFIETNKRNPS